MTKVALILSGCGFMDGAEIHESVLCLLALQEAQYSVEIFAPDIDQVSVVNHLTGQEVLGETRNVLVESARIARGEISSLDALDVDAFDAIMIPGGFGVAKNLSSYATEGANCQVNERLREILLAFHRKGKKIGATCIAPAVLARVFSGVQPLLLTLGSSEDTVAQLNAMGMKGRAVAVTDLLADEENRVFTTPCYMEPPDLLGMYEGIKKVVAKLYTKIA
jgi:enhancing lycopene biosynthesis protein 2